MNLRFAEEISDSSHSSLIAKIADEFTARIVDGESPDVNEYIARVPGSESIVRDVLHSLRLMHDMRRREDDLNKGGLEAKETPGTIGEYEILSEIGRGGMGVVYRARQSTLGRIVALKVLPFAASLDPIKLKRFHVETQSASMIQHPNVVAIYGTGCHQGVHYYAMQYVDGQPLDRYIAAIKSGLASGRIRPAKTGPILPTANDGALTDNPWSDETGAHSTGGCLEIRKPVAAMDKCDEPLIDVMSFQQSADLCRQVALALQAAHGFGVIHRDIKPSNLIIDASRKVWVTDFGLAHIETNGSLTVSGDVLGTLRYMSPEQAIGGNTPIDGRSDVYSLGATLFELLTLEPMLDGNDRATLLRQLTLQEPRPLRLINRAIPKDLETIVLKAVAKESNHRYPSAAALADDLQRFLDHRPILARRPTFLQIAIKMARRHRTAAWVLATVPLVIVAGLVLSNIAISRQIVRAENALKIAQEKEVRATTEAKKARTVSDVLQQLVGAAHPDQTKGNDYTVRQLLDDLTVTLFEQLRDQPDVEASLRSTIGNSYRRLGAPDKAAPHLARALALKESYKESNPLQIAESLEDLAWNESASGRYNQAEELIRQSVELHKKVRERGRPAVHALWCLQHSLIYQHKYLAADSVADEALSMSREIQPMPSETANIMHNLAESKNYQGKYEEAETLARQALELHSKLHGEIHPETGWGLDALARSLQSQKKYAEAEQAFRNALDIFQKNYSSDHRSVRNTLELLQEVLIRSGKTQAANLIDNQRFANTMRKIIVTPDNQKSSLLELLVNRKQYLAAGQLVMAAPDLFQDTNQCLNAVQILIEYSQMISTRFGEDRDDAAKERLLEVSRDLVNRAADQCPDSDTLLNSVAWMLISHPDSRLHQPDRAVEFALRASAAAPQSGETLNTLGLAYLRAGQYSKAVETIEKSQQFPATDEYDIVFLAMALWHTGDMKKPQELLEAAKSMYRKRDKSNVELERFISEADSLIHPASG